MALELTRSPPKRREPEWKGIAKKNIARCLENKERSMKQLLAQVKRETGYGEDRIKTALREMIGAEEVSETVGKRPLPNTYVITSKGRQKWL